LTNVRICYMLFTYKKPAAFEVSPGIVLGGNCPLRSVEDTLGICNSIVKEIKESQILTDHFTELQNEMRSILLSKN
jgi:hypothetical protein